MDQKRDQRRADDMGRWIRGLITSLNLFAPCGLHCCLLYRDSSYLR